MEKAAEARTRTEPRELLSPEQLADYLGCGRTYAYGLLAKGAIPSFKLGKLRRARRVDVDRFIERRLSATK